MKILVCVKHVRLPHEEVELLEDASDLHPECLSSTLNEWDTFAVEEALRLKESTTGDAIVVTCGAPESEGSLRKCLAMGVSRAIRIEGARRDPFSVARALAAVVMAERPDLVLCGAQSSDWAQAATGSALAGLIGWPVVAVVTRIEVQENLETLIVDRELEKKIVDRVEVDLPAVLTVQTGINQPRSATLREIKQAEREPVEVHRFPDEEPPAYQTRRMRIAVRQSRAASLGTGPAEVAHRIAAIVQEHS